jgi:hypothetical protein
MVLGFIIANILNEDKKNMSFLAAESFSKLGNPEDQKHT